MQVEGCALLLAYVSVACFLCFLPLSRFGQSANLTRGTDLWFMGRSLSSLLQLLPPLKSSCRGEMECEGLI